MWSPLGSSAMGSSTLRGSLSVNDIPLLLYKNRLTDSELMAGSDSPDLRKRSSCSSTSSSVSSGDKEQKQEAEAASQAEKDEAGPESTPPPVPPRSKRYAKSSAGRDKGRRTLTPGLETGTGRLLEQGRCVSMPSVVSTPHTPRPQHLLRQQQQQQQHQNHAKTTGSHHRRFLRRFPDINNDEGLIDYYSCALVADILLQGVLYVGERHFAFYSNIFGHKKRLLIPAQNVLKVTKERTAKFIPNAVGIATADHKFVFASLLSRDATFKAVFEVWSRCSDMKTLTGFTPYQKQVSDGEDLDEEDSSPSEVGGVAGTALQDRAKCLGLASSKAQDATEHNNTAGQSVFEHSEDNVSIEATGLSKLPRTSVLLITSTLLLVVLFASATVLVYRIAVIQKKIYGLTSGADIRLNPDITAAHRWKAYQEVSQRHNKVLSDEVGKLTTRLQEHVRHLHQIRLPLEELAATALKMPEFCMSNPDVSTRGQQSQQPMTQAPVKHQQKVHQKQWDTYAAT